MTECSTTPRHSTSACVYSGSALERPKSKFIKTRRLCTKRWITRGLKMCCSRQPAPIMSGRRGGEVCTISPRAHFVNDLINEAHLVGLEEDLGEFFPGSETLGTRTIAEILLGAPL